MSFFFDHNGSYRRRRQLQNLRDTLLGIGMLLTCLVFLVAYMWFAFTHDCKYHRHGTGTQHACEMMGR